MGVHAITQHAEFHAACVHQGVSGCIPHPLVLSSYQQPLPCASNVIKPPMRYSPAHQPGHTSAGAGHGVAQKHTAGSSAYKDTRYASSTSWHLQCSVCIVTPASWYRAVWGVQMADYVVYVHQQMPSSLWQTTTLQIRTPSTLCGTGKILRCLGSASKSCRHIVH